MKKRIALIVVIIVVLLVILFLWRLITLNNIKKLNEESIKISNIYYVREGNDSLVEVWKKDNIVKQNMNNISGSVNLTLWKNFENDEEYTLYNNEKKYSSIGTEIISNELQANNIYLLDYNNTILLALNPMIKINTKEYDNKSCWYLKDRQEEVYIDKETGIVLYNKNEQLGREIKLKYSINTVTDEDVAKPDLSDYKNRYEQ